MRAIDWKELRDLCASLGCVFDRQKGDHYIMTKPGLSRPIVIPRKKGLTENVVLSVGRTLGLSGPEMKERLSKDKPRKAASTKAE